MASGTRNATVPDRSAVVCRFMARMLRRYATRHLNAIRLSRRDPTPALDPATPVVVVLNHPSWWDAILIVLLADRLFPGRAGYAPIDAAMLDRYRVFKRMGAFGIVPGGHRGAARFLAVAQAILARQGTMLWVTAQGRFRDVRERPLRLQPGVAHLAALSPQAVFLPLALEYGLWEERGLEAFAAFGAPIAGRELAALPPRGRHDRLEAALGHLADRLAEDVIARDPERFDVMLGGRAGVGGVYDAGRRLNAWLRGRRFDAAHRPRTAPG